MRLRLNRSASTASQPRCLSNPSRVHNHNSWDPMLGRLSEPAGFKRKPAESLPAICHLTICASAAVRTDECGCAGHSTPSSVSRPPWSRTGLRLSTRNGRLGSGFACYLTRDRALGQPEGWSWHGRADCVAAAQEAREDVGVLGCVATARIFRLPQAGVVGSCACPSSTHI